MEAGTSLRGVVRVPGDKSISHRALLLAALAEGRSELRNLSDGDDVVRTARAISALGASVSGGCVEGGERLLHPPAEPLDLGNSGTGLRLIAGALAGWPWTVRLIGDASLSSRPMDRIAAPLRAMGAEVSGRGERCLPPVTVRGGNLHGIDYEPPMASAQVKSAVLLAALRARGETVVREPVLTRVHTEELLAGCGADISEWHEHGHHVVRVRPSALQAFELDVPSDPSQAAFWLVAACLVPGSEVTVSSVYGGRARNGFVGVLRRMGARIDVRQGAGAGSAVDLTASWAPLQGTEVAAAEIPSLDEVPVLAVAAAAAEGTTVFTSVGELRVKESDRLRGVADLVGAFGAAAEIEGDTLVVHGAGVLRPARVDAAGDHRMAMAAAVAAVAARRTTEDGSSTVSGWEAVATSYPRFAAHLRQLGGQIALRERR